MTQKKERNSCKSCNFSLHNFFTGLGGLGSLLLGIAACIALFKTDTVLEEIFKIQKMAKDIETSVNDLRSIRKEKKVNDTPIPISNEDNQQVEAKEETHESATILPPPDFSEDAQQNNSISANSLSHSANTHQDHDKKNEVSQNAAKTGAPNTPNSIKNPRASENLEGLKKYLRVDDKNRRRGDIYLPQKDFEKLEKEFTTKTPEEIRDFLRDKLQFEEGKNTPQ